MKRQYYRPYGDVRYSDGLDTELGFTGQRADASTGLMFYGARYYDPAIGQFITTDTVVPNPTKPQNLNRYSYVRNNPIVAVDPSGHCPQEYRDISNWNRCISYWVNKIDILDRKVQNHRATISLAADLTPGLGK